MLLISGENAEFAREREIPKSVRSLVAVHEVGGNEDVDLGASKGN